MTTFAYLRVSSRRSTNRQSTDSQRHALTAYIKSKGIKSAKWIEDYSTGRNVRRTGLTRLLSAVQLGDTIIVSDLSRFSRSVRDTLQLVESLMKQGVTLTCLNPSLTFDQTAMSKFTLTLFAALSELESAWKGERIKSALDLRRQQGQRLGRSPELATRRKVLKLLKTHSVADTASICKVSRQAIYQMRTRISA